MPYKLHLGQFMKVPETDFQSVWVTWSRLLNSFLSDDLDLSSLHQGIREAYLTRMTLTNAAAVPFTLWPLEHYSFLMQAEITDSECEVKEAAEYFRSNIDAQFIQRSDVFEMTTLVGIEHLNAPLLARGYRHSSDLFRLVSISSDLLQAREGVAVPRIRELADQLPAVVPDCLCGVLHRDLLYDTLMARPSATAADVAAVLDNLIRLENCGQTFRLESKQSEQVYDRLNRLTGHTEMSVTVYDGAMDHPVVRIEKTGASIDADRGDPAFSTDTVDPVQTNMPVHLVDAQGPGEASPA